jgi:NADPH2:quinone reductase
VLIPANVDFDVASAYIVTYGTSYHALKDRARLKPGENLVVLGAAGGVGSAAVELGVAMGARVIAGATTQEKVDLAIEQGAAAGFVYPRLPLSRDQQKALSDKIKELTGGKGADVLYDPVGDQYAEPSLRAMNWEGRYLVIGFAAGEIPKIPLNLTLLKGCDVLGVFWGMATQRDPQHAHASLKEIVKMISDGKLHLKISAKYPLAEGAVDRTPGAKATGKDHDVAIERRQRTTANTIRDGRRVILTLPRLQQFTDCDKIAASSARRNRRHRQAEKDRVGNVLTWTC